MRNLPTFRSNIHPLFLNLTTVLPYGQINVCLSLHHRLAPMVNHMLSYGQPHLLKLTPMSFRHRRRRGRKLPNCCRMTINPQTDLVYTVSKMLGHTNLKTTQIYAKVVDEKKDKAANAIKLNINNNKKT